MRKSLFFVTLFFLITSIAQGESIEGLVQSGASGEPVPYANISLTGTDQGTVSDTRGYFHIVVDSLPVRVEIGHIQFKNRQVVIREKYPRILLEPDVLQTDEIRVIAGRAVKGKTPVAFTQLNQQEISSAYSHQDVPMVLDQSPGVYAYSDAGNGTGYSYLKIRGFSQDRIGIMLNGIPLNDPESHSVYWVDHGDILSAVSHVQIQRGTGNFLNGATVFGGTVNLETNYTHLPRGFQVSTGYGNYLDASGLDLPGIKLSSSYNGLPFKSNNLFLYGRGSYLDNPGYRKGSGSTQKSFHLGLQKQNPDNMTRVEWIFGDEKTHFSWDGISPQYGFDLKDREDRRYNYYADPEYNGGFDNANKDVFTQHILSLQHSRKYHKSLLNLTLYTVKGDGYYEQFAGGKSVIHYNLTSLLPDTASVDLIQQRWLKNSYQGFLLQYNIRTFPKIDLTLGAESRFYQSDHFGRVKSLVDHPFDPPDNHTYYDSDRRKNTLSFYIHTIGKLTETLNLLADFRVLGHVYSVDQDPVGAYQGHQFDLRYLFADPRLGLIWEPEKDLSFFINFSTAHREPADSDIYDESNPEAEPAIESDGSKYATPLVKEERLFHTEIGMDYSHQHFTAAVNLYRMDFRDELIPMDYRYRDDDNVLKANVPQTLHQGIEADIRYRINRTINLQSTFSLSQNTFIEFKGDAYGWGGFGSLADFSGNTIPGYPSLMAGFTTHISLKKTLFRLNVKYNGRQYIDFSNTEDAVISPYTLVNMAFELPVLSNKSGKLVLDGKIYNLFDTLYETFGYNYYLDPETRIDVYWPGGTRNYFLTLTWHVQPSS